MIKGSSYIFIFLFFSYFNSLAQETTSTSKEYYGIDSVRKALKNRKLLLVCFESAFNGEDVKIENKSQTIFRQKLHTNEKLGVAKRVYLSKKDFPVKIYVNEKVYELKRKDQKCIYVTLQNKELSFEYSNIYRLYK